MQSFKDFLNEETVNEARNVTPKQVVTATNKIIAYLEKFDQTLEDYENSDATLDGKNPDIDTKILKKVEKLINDTKSIKDELERRLR